MWTENFQMYNLYLEKAEQPEIKLPTSLWSQKKQGNSRKKKNCFIDYAKSFHCGDHNKLCKLHRDGNTKPPYLPPEKRMQVKKLQLELDMW